MNFLQSDFGLPRRGTEMKGEGWKVLFFHKNDCCFPSSQAIVVMPSSQTKHDYPSTHILSDVQEEAVRLCKSDSRQDFCHSVKCINPIQSTRWE